MFGLFAKKAGPEDMAAVDRAMECGDYAAAWRLLQPLIKARDPQGLVAAGCMMRDGQLGAPDYPKAASLFAEAAAAGSQEGRAYLGLLSVDPRSTLPKDPVRAVTLLREAALGGYAHGYYFLAEVNLRGWNGAPDPALALEDLSRGATAGDAQCGISYAEKLLYEAGGQPDVARALDVLASVAEGSSKAYAAQAHMILGEIHSRGQFVDPDYARADAHFEKGAVAMRAAHYERGQLRETGKLSGEPSPALAAPFYQAGIERGCDWAMAAMARLLACSPARLLAEGRGVTRDVNRARALFGRAADLGNASAAFDGGTLALEALEGQPRHREAGRQFQRAFELGDPRGARMVARMIWDGIGVEADRVSAENWFQDAGLSGDYLASAEIAERLHESRRAEPARIIAYARIAIDRAPTETARSEMEARLSPILAAFPPSEHEASDGLFAQFDRYYCPRGQTSMPGFTDADGQRIHVRL